MKFKDIEIGDYIKVTGYTIIRNNKADLGWWIGKVIKQDHMTGWYIMKVYNYHVVGLPKDELVFVYPDDKVERVSKKMLEEIMVEEL